MWALSAHSSPAALLVDLSATDKALGELGTWVNQGSLPGNFETAGLTPPQVVLRDEIHGVLFPNSLDPLAGAHYVGPSAPPSLTGGGARTIEAWVFDESPQPEKVIVAWGHRGGPDGTNCSFGHGTDPGFGAMAHWGNPGPDLGWNHQLTFNAWTHIAYTFDGVQSRTFRDGHLATTEATALNTWASDDNGLPIPIRIARQNSRIGTPSAAGIGEIVIGRIKIHDRALSETEILKDFEAERRDFGLDDPDADGLPSWFESRFAFLNPLDPTDAALDQDSDGLSNLGEFLAGTQLENPDTDNDGLLDGAEMSHLENGTITPTNPLVADSDQDGLSDLEEELIGTHPTLEDSDGDGTADGQELLHASNPLDPASRPDLLVGPPAIDLDLTTLPLGPAPLIRNLGFLRGEFVTASASAAIMRLEGVNGITLRGGDLDYYTGPIIPQFLAHDFSRTVEAWVYNPTVEEQETIISWGRRGGPDGTHFSFNHGNSPTTGAAVHWRQPDLGWRDQVVAGAWTYLVYVHGAEESAVHLYSNGVEVNSISGIILDTWPVDDRVNPRGLPVRIGCQNNSDGEPAPGLRATLTLARLRVYDRALHPEAIAANYRREGLDFRRPKLSGITYNPVNQSIQLKWEEALDRRYSIEGSTDLTDWTKLGLGVEGRFTVPALPNQPHRYFRLRAE